MALIRVTASKLRQAAADLRTQNGQFKSEISGLTDIEGKLNGQWEGEARSAFHTAFTNDKTQMDSFSNLIEEYCKALEEMARKYEEEERKNTEIATKRSYK